MGVVIKKFIFVFIFIPLVLFSNNDISQEELKQKSFKILLSDVNFHVKKLNEKMILCDKTAQKNLLPPNLFDSISLTKKELKYTLAYFYAKTLDSCSFNELSHSYLAYMKLILFVKKDFPKSSKLERFENEINKLYSYGYDYTTPKIYFEKYVREEVKEKVKTIKELNKPFSFESISELLEEEKTK